MSRLLRQAISDSREAIAMEGVSDVVKDIKKMFSGLPKIKKKDFEPYAMHLKKELKEYRDVIEKHYANPSWVAQQGARVRDVKATDITSVFSVAGRFNNNITGTIQHDISTIVKLHVDFYKAESAWTRDMKALYKTVEKQNVDQRVEAFAKGLKTIPSPLSRVNVDLKRVSGGFEIIEVSSAYPHCVIRQKHGTGPATLPALTEKEMLEKGKLMLKLIDSIFECLDASDHSEDYFFELFDYMSEDEYGALNEKQMGVVGMAWGEGIPSVEVEEGLWKVMLHLLDEAVALEKYIQRSI